jgi:protocatechuate 3,4-dioxygenase beta subunit
MTSHHDDKEETMAKELTTNQRLGRREAFRLVGAAGAAALVGRNLVGEPCAAQDTGTPACVVTPALTEGPYFVEEKLYRPDIRWDPAVDPGKAGVPLLLTMNLSQVASGSCTPLTGATVDIWHCDALGVYSDVAGEGSAGKKFLRGYQVTDANGAVQFATIYPGWYRGRAVHIHFKVRMFAGTQETYEFTSQLFFDDAVTDVVHALAPYSAKGVRDTRNSADNIYMQAVNDGTGRSSGELLLVPVVKAEKAEEGYRGTFDIGVRLT